MRNAELEAQIDSLPHLKESAIQAQKRVDVLLVMLGEKEEELEALVGDMKDVKSMYQGQMEALLEQLT